MHKLLRCVERNKLELRRGIASSRISQGDTPWAMTDSDKSAWVAHIDQQTEIQIRMVMSNTFNDIETCTALKQSLGTAISQAERLLNVYREQNPL